jgi:hypothetical protein
MVDFNLLDDINGYDISKEFNSDGNIVKLFILDKETLEKLAYKDFENGKWNFIKEYRSSKYLYLQEIINELEELDSAINTIDDFIKKETAKEKGIIINNFCLKTIGFEDFSISRTYDFYLSLSYKDLFCAYKNQNKEWCIDSSYFKELQLLKRIIECIDAVDNWLLTGQ